MGLILFLCKISWPESLILMLIFLGRYGGMGVKEEYFHQVFVHVPVTIRTGLATGAISLCSSMYSVRVEVGISCPCIFYTKLRPDAAQFCFIIVSLNYCVIALSYLGILVSQCIIVSLYYFIVLLKQQNVFLVMTLLSVFYSWQYCDPCTQTCNISSSVTYHVGPEHTPDMQHHTVTVTITIWKFKSENVLVFVKTPTQLNYWARHENKLSWECHTRRYKLS